MKTSPPLPTPPLRSGHEVYERMIVGGSLGTLGLLLVGVLEMTADEASLGVVARIVATAVFVFVSLTATLLGRNRASWILSARDIGFAIAKSSGLLAMAFVALSAGEGTLWIAVASVHLLFITFHLDHLQRVADFEVSYLEHLGRAQGGASLSALGIAVTGFLGVLLAWPWLMTVVPIAAGASGLAALRAEIAQQV